MRNLVGGNLHAQVAAGDHDGIGNLDDFLDVLNGVGVLDLCHDADAAAAVVGEERSDGAYVVAAAHKRCRHEVDALFDAEQQVFFVLLGHDGQGHVGAGKVQLLAFAEHARVLHGALDVGAHNAVDRKLDQAIVDKDDGAGLYELMQALESLVHAAGGAQHVFFGEEEVVAGTQQNRLCAFEFAGADRRALRVEHDGAGCVQLTTDLLQAVHARFVLGMGAMGKVAAGNVHAC